MKLNDIESVETEDSTASHMQKTISEGKDCFESKHRRKDGSLFDVEVSVQYSDVHRSLFAAFLRDITEKKRQHEDLGIVDEQVRRRIAGEVESVHYEFRGIRKNGDVVHVEIYGSSIVFKGRPAAIGTMLDVTARKKAEQELERALLATERQAKELQLLLDGAKAVLEGSDFPATARRIFDAACEMTGAVSGYVALLSDDGEENEVLFLESGGLPCSVDESLPMPIRGLRGGAYKTGQAVFDNDFMNSPWGDFMPEGHVDLRNVMFAPLNIEGKTVGIMGLANKPEDFTEDDLRIAGSFGQLAAIALRNSIVEERLKYSERRNQALLDHSPLCHKIVDLDFNLQYMSSNGFKMLKLNANADVYGEPYPFYFFPESFRNEMEENLRKVKETGCIVTMEALANDIEGDGVWLESAIIPVFSDGLGLSSVYGIVKDHGGYITCYSEVGQGTTFKIHLPAIVQPEIEEREDFEPQPNPRGTETILLVDDEAAIRGFAEQALMKFGYKVMTSSTGEEALDLYSDKSIEIDLVITDIGMPGMGGHKLLQELLRINPQQKVLIASGYSMEGQVKQSMEAGAKGYVGKPYQLADLLNTVRAVLDEDC